MQKNFREHFIKFTEMIRNDIHFGFARYSDGEVALMKGSQIGQNSQAYQIDKWSSPIGLSIVGERLLESLQHTEDNYHYAISAHSDSIDDYTFLSERIQNPNITFANLWINSNYQKMYNFYNTLDKSVYVICNHKAKKENFPFKVNEIFPFPDDCVKYWIEYGDDYIVQLIEYVSQIQNQTILVSAGPISEILIHYMFSANPNNQYIDVGSSIDEFTHGYKTRPYMNPSSQYANETSYFYE